LNEKKLFFDQLSALNESSDEEYDTNNVRDVLRKSKKLSPLPSFSAELSPGRIRTPFNIRKVLRKRQMSSAPTPSGSFIEESPLPRTVSLSRHFESTSFSSAKTSVKIDTPGPQPHEGKRATSNPTVGADSLVLNYSAGIESMLGKRNRARLGPSDGKKRLRKKPSVKLVPEKEQIFRGCVFYYIPPDDKSLFRRTRINKARTFGATWTKELTLSITHIVVDKAITFKDVMTFLKLETLPSNITMVSEDYPIDSINFGFLLDHTQEQYAVSGYQETCEGKITPQFSRRSELKASESKSGAGDAISLEKTSHQSERAIQASESKAIASKILFDSSPAVFMARNGSQRDSKFEEGSQETYHCAGTVSGANEFNWRHDLEDMIRVARSVEDVPINDEEDDQEDERPPSRDQPDESGSDDESRRPSHNASKPMWKGSREGSFNQQNFSCMIGGTGVTTDANPNARTIEVLQKMADYYVETKDHWRQTAYRKAIGVLRKQPTKICTYDEAFRLPTIGNRLALKIEEIVLTNGLRKLTDAMSDPNYHILQTFINIYGVGINQAWKWVQQGHKTLEDLKVHVSLTKNQRLGIEHYDEFLIRIPRDEVTALGNIVKTAAATIDPKVEIIIGGSYRRGASSSGDIDFILTKPSTTSSQDLLDFLERLTNQLKESGFLVAALVLPSQAGSKWHGCCVLPGTQKPIWRRMDLLLVPETELGAALIYFTGDDIFNRSIRLLANKKGWRLNQRGLFKDVLRGPGGVKLSEGSLMEGADEKKIFAALDVPWRPPEQRVCH
jgi:DNA polymerase IV